MKLKEVASLLKLRKVAERLGFESGSFPHIIGLHEVLRDSSTHKLHMVFEYVALLDYRFHFATSAWYRACGFRRCDALDYKFHFATSAWY
jgi:hypothetical protein